MTIQEMRDKKKERGYSYALISELSGVPLGTVQKIFGGQTDSPRYDTLMALEKLFSDICAVREPAASYGGTEPHTQGSYTLEDYYALPEDQRVELIDGRFYEMQAPATLHQRIAGEVYRQIANYILDQGGDCQPFIAPVDVQLDCDNKTMVEPDVMIICDEYKVEHRCIYGAPDFILEIISPSTKKKDYTKKLSKYENAGVKEYWILDPYQNRLLIYDFRNDILARIVPLDQPEPNLVPIGIYEGKLLIDFKHIQKWIEAANLSGDQQ